VAFVETQTSCGFFFDFLPNAKTRVC
jgi:hypothetical protein